MLSGEKMVLLVFLAVVVGVFVAAASLGIRAMYRRIKGKGWNSNSRMFRWSCIIIWSLAGFGVLCMAQGYFVEPYWLDVNEVVIFSDKLPAGAGPIRIVHISDLHCDPKIRLEDKLPQVIAELKPDLIAFTGDAINSQAGLDNFRRCISELTKIAPVYAVKGNWDVWYFPEIDRLGGTDVKLLRGDVVELELRGAKLNIAGVDYDATSTARRVLAGLDADAFNVFLYHTPDMIFELADGGVDLCLSGHTHGGQIALPFYGAIITLSRYGKRFESGLKKVDDTHMYVSRGIGMEGGRAPRVRFWSRPEVTLIKIVPEG